MQYLIRIKNLFYYSPLQILRHKIVIVFLAVTILAGGYFSYFKIFSENGSVRYATAQARNGTIVVSITGSGQVSATQQMDIKAKVSGDVTYVNVKAGQYVAAGTLIAQLYAREAQKSVRDAEINLESAQLNYDQITGSINGIRGDKEKNEEGLAKSYDDGLNAVVNAFADFPNIMTSLNTILINTDFEQGQWNIDYYADAIRLYDEDISIVRDETYAKYKVARKAYDENLIDYKLVSRFSGAAEIEAVINQTYETGRLISEAVKDASNFVQIYKDKMTEANRQPKALADSHLLNLNGHISKSGSLIQSLYYAKNNILSGKESLIGADFDIRSAKIQLDKAKDALLDAQEKLAEYYIRAPFGGVVAKLNVKIGDTAVSNVATLITKQKIAEVSLNEIDAAKIKVGQKATLTFDAIPDLTIMGQVAEVDALGTVSQGVVTYTVKIGFDAQDDRVKIAMSVSAAINTDIKQNVLLIPNSAVKFQGNNQYVEIVEGEDRSDSLAANISGVILKNTPRRQTIKVGLSNDEFTEILDGLQEEDIIITRTIQLTNIVQSTQQSSGLRIPGLPGGGNSSIRGSENFNR